ncbi:aldo/keto reductase [Zongyangia hominis]|uniref:Aldo/keto reductase n=1 Tax=Zongyangia hominis TaxID=2763677 RepID=A0A926E8I3_9FIRM|nr:aldo/keto reductase [Zongyangia hominis]MBC8569272.1 aldo/keto reductase [Zongyangia hominis]
MQYASLTSGKDSLNMSKIVLGTMIFGTRLTEKASFEMLDYFLAQGGNCIDTARAYVNDYPGGEGLSETIIGRWLRDRGNRDKVILSTKGGHPSAKDKKTIRLGREEVASDLEESLRNLGVECVDIYWLHRDDPNRSVSYIVDYLDEFVKAGKIRFPAVSNWSARRIAEANAYAAQAGKTPIAMSQIQWSLAATTKEQYGDPTMETMTPEEYAWYRESGMPVMAYCPQAKGFFSKYLTGGEEALNEKARKRFLSPQNIARAGRVQALSEKTGLSPAAVALSYITSNPVPGFAIVGCSNMEQLADSLSGADLVLDEAQVAALCGE